MQLSEDEKKARLEALQELLVSEDGHVEDAPTLTAEDHLSAMFESEANLSEDGKAKIKTLFEAAVGYEVEKQVAVIVSEKEQELATAIESNKAEIHEEVDAYLTHVVEEWAEKNTVALNSKIKLDIFESFVSGMRDLFLEHNIDIPAEKADMVEGLMTRIESLEEDVKTMARKNVRMSEELDIKAREVAFNGITEGMTSMEVEKLRSLVESKKFDNAEEFTKGVSLIKESYFKQVQEPIIEEVPAPKQEPEIAPNVLAYADMITKNAKSKK